MTLDFNMSLTSTPYANRLHIAIFGRRNSGKSSLINALTMQQTSVVSSTPGTTTDVVTRAMELSPIGACLFIDTPGFDDHGELGELRIARTLQTVERTDIALLLCEDGDYKAEQEWFRLFKERNIAVIPIINKADIRTNIDNLAEHIVRIFDQEPIVVSALTKEGLGQIHKAILRKLPEDFGQHTITGNLVGEGDLVLLVMPQDIQAPKGRLILPQMQTMRELLDKKCLVVSCTTDKLQDTFKALSHAPKLIITDSQHFSQVFELKPKESLLTSFSVLFAGHKGDIETFVQGAKAIDSLTPQSRVLIAEACTHAPLTEDIGRVKIPRMLRQRVGEGVQIEIVSGMDFPDDLSSYDLVIHCGGCMFNRKYMLNRIAEAKKQKKAITNYGVVIAHINGILDKIVW